MYPDDAIRELKNELRAEMKILFPDLSLAKEVCWGPSVVSVDVVVFTGEPKDVGPVIGDRNGCQGE